MKQVGSILVLLGICLLFTGTFVVRGETVVEKPYLVENETVPQAHMIFDLFTYDDGQENYVYVSTFGFNWIQQENTVSVMFALGENLLEVDENNVWHWNISEDIEHLSFVADIKDTSITALGNKMINTIEFENIVMGEEPMPDVVGSVEFIYPAFEFGTPLSILENYELGISLTLNTEEENEELMFVLAFDPSTKSVMIFKEVIENLDVMDIDYTVVKNVGQRKLVNYDVTAEKENVGKLVGYGIIVTPNLYRFDVYAAANEYWWMISLCGVVLMLSGVFALTRPMRRVYGR